MSWIARNDRSRSPSATGKDEDEQNWGGQWRNQGWSIAKEEDAIPEPWYIDGHDLTFEPTQPPCSEEDSESTAAGHAFTLLLLHSCSGGPDDFLPFVHRLNVPFRNRTRIVLPCSPVRKEEHHGWEGTQNSWFEYDDSQGCALKHPEQLFQQRRRILRLLEQERLRLPGADARRIIIGGLSQGVSLAIDIALHAPYAVGGILALRGMALQGCLDKELVAKRQAIAEGSTGNGHEGVLELLAYHGAGDRQCPADDAKASYEALRPLGVNVVFELDETLGHACARGRQRLCAREFRWIADFLKERWGAYLKEPDTDIAAR